MSVLALFATLAQEAQAERIKVERDDLVVTKSCILEPSGLQVADTNGDGVVQITGSDITVQFANTELLGAKSGEFPDTFSGIGVRVTGKNVTLKGAIISGYKCALWASGADGLIVDGYTVSGNFCQRLKSTSKAEDGADWLWPHENDGNEWLTNYGAAIYVEDSKGVVIRNCFARAGQNGICLRKVSESKIYDNDMSFLSGWGLALYRSSNNVVAHNSFDFCVRGYSHGVYSRGQDSAGILCFEQSCDNVFAFNSATHSGDGFFGFAGTEALEERSDQAGLGCNRNLLYANDFSYAPAIGIEMTFSRDNSYVKNRLVGSNYGVWGGYSNDTRIVDNEIADNTLAGIAIEHGTHWFIAGNRFARNARAIELWWDDDKDLLAKPWAKLNPTRSTDYVVTDNLFEADAVQLEVRGGTKGVAWRADNEGTDRSRWRGEDVAAVNELAALSPAMDAPGPGPEVPGQREAVGALKHLEGRDKIIVTEWGPYDWQAPMLYRDADRGDAHAWRLLGNEIAIGCESRPEVAVRMDASSMPPVVLVSARKSGRVLPYELKVRTQSQTLTGKGLLMSSTWKVTCGNWTSDPRDQDERWRGEVRNGVTFEAPRLVLRFGNGGPSDLEDAPKALKDAKLGQDRFGTIASTRIELPKGKWRLSTTSDDGVRVTVDGKKAIDNWTWHVPTTDTAELQFDSDGSHEIAVEHFELDGYSVLELDLVPVE